MAKYYFVSDVHLGQGTESEARLREARFVLWLDQIKGDAKGIFLLGDIFDFWFEYKSVVPRGFTRTLGKLAEIADMGIPIHFFVGNHDLWVTDYLEKEVGLIIHHHSLEIMLDGKMFFLSHGDALDFKDRKHLFIRKLFTNPFLRFLFAAVHPRWGVGLAQHWSVHSRNKEKHVAFQGEDEGLYQFANHVLKEKKIDCFIFGHRHTPLLLTMEKNNAKFCILGEWLSGKSPYASFASELRIE